MSAITFAADCIKFDTTGFVPTVDGFYSKPGTGTWVRLVTTDPERVQSAWDFHLGHVGVMSHGVP